MSSPSTNTRGTKKSTAGNNNPSAASATDVFLEAPSLSEALIEELRKNNMALPEAILVNELSEQVIMNMLLSSEYSSKTFTITKG